MTQPLDYASPMDDLSSLILPLENEYATTGRYRNASRYFRSTKIAAAYVAQRMRERIESLTADHRCIECGGPAEGLAALLLKVRIRQKRLASLSNVEGFCRSIHYAAMCEACIGKGRRRERRWRWSSRVFAVIAAIGGAGVIISAICSSELRSLNPSTLALLAAGVAMVGIVSHSFAMANLRRSLPSAILQLDTPETRFDFVDRRLHATKPSASHRA